LAEKLKNHEILHIFIIDVLVQNANQSLRIELLPKENTEKFR